MPQCLALQVGLQTNGNKHFLLMASLIDVEEWQVTVGPDCRPAGLVRK